LGAIPTSVQRTKPRLNRFDREWFRWPELHQTVYAENVLASVLVFGEMGTNAAESRGSAERGADTTGQGCSCLPKAMLHLKSCLVLCIADISCSGPSGDNGVWSCGRSRAWIPIEIGSLKNLFCLNLRRNRLQGPIPFQLGDLTNLAMLDLSANCLTGNIPQELRILPQLSLLNLSNNFLYGRYTLVGLGIEVPCDC
ncbi:hypothetical protein BDR26DRAFT_637552, partial [Obelidium mucronatum]